jgi:tetratricopeptide (TPR) repeat protein
MFHKWFDAREVTEIGAALADELAPKQLPSAATLGGQSVSRVPNEALFEILQRAEREVGALRLNFYKKAKFANSFKWRLLENGVERLRADEVTQQLVLHLSRNQSKTVESPTATATDLPHRRDARHLLTQGNRSLTQGDFAEAITLYQELITLNPRHAIAINNLGTAFYKLGRYREAEGRFYQAIKVKPDFADAHSNLGNMFLLKGQFVDAENFLRHALKLNPRFVDARINLGLTLVSLSRLREAKSHLEKALKYEPRNSDALFGMALIAKTEGSFADSETLLSRALQLSPNMPKALASQAGLRKMRSSDTDWLDRAEKVAASGIAALDESELRFAIGKYHDDVENYKQAFQNYKRANDLLKAIAEPYDRSAHKQFVDMLIRAYTPEVLAQANGGVSVSMKPVFVVGMPRSGTSLTEQIISSHPSAIGAGELTFWSSAVHDNAAALENGLLSESTRSKLADAYLRVLDSKSTTALRIVDKAPVNSDYLGIIHSVFPNARIIYMRRHPIDTCLSCYFQRFVQTLNFTGDLSDLADYYRQHERLIEHWRSALPAGSILDVPYEELVADHEGWTRKILDFLGLDWNERCLDFHKTNRAVATASYWQVRQAIYKTSVQRWRNYERFVGPLLELKDLAH